MSFTSKIGKVTLFPTEKECLINWDIYRYLYLKEEDSVGYGSPFFSFEGEYWELVIWPVGSKYDRTAGFIDLGLIRNSSNGPPINIEFSFALKSSSGLTELQKCSTGVFKKSTRHEVNKLISKSDLRKRQAEFLPFGTITVICTLNKLSSTGSTNDLEATECSYCKETFDVKIISTHEKKCRIKCPECSDLVLYQKWDDHECEISGIEDLGSLIQDFKKVLLDGTDHNIILKTGDKELQAHRDILKARSEVFKSMLSHDMVETKTGVINIPDCDPEAMEQFLLYVYCGKVEKLDENNMTALYYIADKYEMTDLKNICCEFIKQSLSLTNVCKIIQLATNHSNCSLLDFATEYFTNNLLDILHTVEWQSFLKDNPTVANELFIKSQEKKN